MHPSDGPRPPGPWELTLAIGTTLTGLLASAGVERSGALGAVDGRDLAGTISFDQALTDAWAFSHHEDATTVQVTLGSSDAWGGGEQLYYLIDWSEICGPAPGPTHLPGSSFAPPPSCGVTQWGTVIDATSGAFVVEGSA
jgi:hypothetical protein